eukprot:356266-Chlamydomonas_euryale.AAC.1
MQTQTWTLSRRSREVHQQPVHNGITSKAILCGPYAVVLGQFICKSEHQKACPVRHRKKEFRSWRDAQFAKRQLDPSKAEVTVMMGWLQHEKKELHFSSMAVAALKDKGKGLRAQDHTRSQLQGAVILYDNDAAAVVAGSCSLCTKNPNMLVIRGISRAGCRLACLKASVSDKDDPDDDDDDDTIKVGF